MHAHYGLEAHVNDARRARWMRACQRDDRLAKRI